MSRIPNFRPGHDNRGHQSQPETPMPELPPEAWDIADLRTALRSCITEVHDRKFDAPNMATRRILLQKRLEEINQIAERELIR